MQYDDLRPDRRTQQLSQLLDALTEGTLSRRDFAARAIGLGLSAPAIGVVLRTYSASAAALQDDSDNPITVTIGGTPIADPLEDLANAVPGGVLRFARSEDADNLDPVTTALNVNIWVFMNVYEQLLRVANNGIELEPGLAERWEISEDGLTYTFYLREGVVFHDGSPMTASDVKYSIDRAKDDPSETWTFTLTSLEEVTVQDDLTVVLRLNRPWAPFLSSMAMFNSSVIPEAFAAGQEERLVEEMMGTGPFRQGEWRRGDYLSLSKNETYWQPDLPFLDEVRISVVPDDNNRLLQLLGGEIDAMYNIPPSQVPELKANPDLKVIEFPSTFSRYVVLNHSVAPLDDPKVRLALNYATDKQALIDVVLFGSGSEPTSFMPRGALYWNDQLPGFPYDPDRARELLAESSAADGFQLDFKFMAGSVEEEQLGTVLRDMWSQVGVDLTLTPVEQGIFYDDFFAQAFESMTIYWTNDIIDPDQLVSFMVLPESANAFQTGWTNEEALELARSGPLELDSEARREIYFRIQEIFNDEAPVVLLYHKPYVNAMTTAVHNFLQPPTGQWDWRATWIES
jgi:peptide/nickel transport system substrate-binding protein